MDDSVSGCERIGAGMGGAEHQYTIAIPERFAPSSISECAGRSQPSLTSTLARDSAPIKSNACRAKPRERGLPLVVTNASMACDNAS